MMFLAAFRFTSAGRSLIGWLRSRCCALLSCRSSRWWFVVNFIVIVQQIHIVVGHISISRSHFQRKFTLSKKFLVLITCWTAKAPPNWRPSYLQYTKPITKRFESFPYQKFYFKMNQLSRFHEPSNFQLLKTISHILEVTKLACRILEILKLSRNEQGRTKLLLSSTFTIYLQIGNFVFYFF